MVPKKDRASGGAAIGVANSGLARRPLVFLLVVASILINWNYPLSISIQIGSGATAHRFHWVTDNWKFVLLIRGKQTSFTGHLQSTVLWKA